MVCNPRDKPVHKWGKGDTENLQDFTKNKQKVFNGVRRETKCCILLFCLLVPRLLLFMALLSTDPAAPLQEKGHNY